MSRDTFVREARAGLERLGDGLLDLEDDDGGDTVDELFRTAHSLKSTFGMEGHETASELAHALEDVLEDVRAGALEPDEAVVDETLATVDTLEQMLKEIDRDGTTEIDPDSRIDALHGIIDTAAERPDGSPDRPGDDAAVSEGSKTTGRSSSGASGDTGNEDEQGGVEAEQSDIDDEEVRRALEAASEFDDLDALVAEMDEPDDIGPVDDGGAVATFEHETGESQREADDTERTGLDAAAEETDPEPEDGSRSFAGINSEVDAEETSLERLQSEIAEESFGEFDDEDDMSIQELLELDPDEQTEASDEKATDEASTGVSDRRPGEAEDTKRTTTGEEHADASISGDGPEQVPPTPDGPKRPAQSIGDDDGSVSAEPERTDDRAEAGSEDGVTAPDTPAEQSPDLNDTDGPDLAARAPELNETSGADSERDAGFDIDTVGTDSRMEEFESRFDSLREDRDPVTTREVATVEASGLRTDRFRPAGSERTRQTGASDGVQSLTVDIEYADDLLSLVEELSLDAQRLRSRADERDVLETAESIDTTVRTLQRTVMGIRLMPVETVTKSLKKVARRAARETGKDVELTVEGAGARVDRSIIDRLRNPLVHLVRNAVDHGIEPPEAREAAGKEPTGSVTVRVERAGEHITVAVRDDGGGIDPDEVREAAVEADVCSREEAAALPEAEVYDLVTHPGLSTAEEVTSTSGRGVGMDVVRESVEAVNGHLTVESTPGEGTTVNLRLPVTMAVTDVLLVAASGQEFALPLTDVVRVGTSLEGTGHDHTAEPDIDRRVKLGRALGLEPDDDGDSREVLVETREETLAVDCDDVIDQRTAIVTPYDELLAGIPELSGATTGTDEQLVHVLDVSKL